MEWDDLEETLTLGKRPGSVQKWSGRNDQQGSKRRGPLRTPSESHQKRGSPALPLGQSAGRGLVELGGMEIPPPRNLEKGVFDGGTLALTGNLATRIPWQVPSKKNTRRKVRPKDCLHPQPLRD